MQVVELEIPDAKLLTPKKFSDHRGFFSEIYNLETLKSVGIDITFVQENHFYSATKGTIRGLHFQAPPFAQDKLLRVVRGSTLDVAVDIRKGSPTYGRHVSVVITAEAWNQILIPIGFAHGILILEPDTEVCYKVSNYYSPEHELGLLWNDPDLGIDWPISPKDVVLSEKDRMLPTFDNFDSPFEY